MAVKPEIVKAVEAVMDAIEALHKLDQEFAKALVRVMAEEAADIDECALSYALDKAFDRVTNAIPE